MRPGINARRHRPFFPSDVIAFLAIDDDADGADQLPDRFHERLGVNHVIELFDPEWSQMVRVTKAGIGRAYKRRCRELGQGNVVRMAIMTLPSAEYLASVPPKPKDSSSGCGRTANSLSVSTIAIS